MKKSIQSVSLAFIFLTVLLSGCAPASTPMPPTATSTHVPPTETPMPPTFTPIPPTATNTSIPTATVIPEIGKPVSSANWEFTLIAVSLLKRGVKDPEVGGEVLPSNGARFVSVGFRVAPIGSVTAVSAPQVFILDENSQKHGGKYLGSQDATQEIDPLKISVKRSTFMWIASEEIDITTDIYMHIIFEIPSTSLGKGIYFKFDDVPAIPFMVK